jgi:nucleotidyltransferase substrate binding protein (TIGR01987 family)
MNNKINRYELALQQFEKALTRLQEVLAVQEPEESSIVRDATIQRFEFTFEAAWKAMYRWIWAQDHPVNEMAAAVIPMAFSFGLISQEKAWGNMRKFRNDTSHTYEESIAIEVAAFVRQEAVVLFAELLKTLQERKL